MKQDRIILNAIRCKKCGMLIVSEHRHDYKACDCKTIAVDGGCDYLRRIGILDKFTEESVVCRDGKYIALRLENA